MKSNTLTRFAAVAAVAVLGCGAGVALAADITGVAPSAASVALDGGRATVRFNVGGSASPQDRCGYFVEYGDGMAGDSRVLERENGQFVRLHERTFTAPGTYTVRASGRSVKTTSGCNGAASATVTVVAAAVSSREQRRDERRAERRAAEAPVCPQGWMLNEKSVNRMTGAFSCRAKPAEELVCPEGLRYFERDGVIGCRQGRRS